MYSHRAFRTICDHRITSHKILRWSQNQYFLCLCVLTDKGLNQCIINEWPMKGILLLLRSTSLEYPSWTPEGSREGAQCLRHAAHPRKEGYPALRPCSRYHLCCIKLHTIYYIYTIYSEHLNLVLTWFDCSLAFHFELYLSMYLFLLFCL